MRKLNVRECYFNTWSTSDLVDNNTNLLNISLSNHYQWSAHEGGSFFKGIRNLQRV